MSFWREQDDFDPRLDVDLIDLARDLRSDGRAEGADLIEAKVRSLPAWYGATLNQFGHKAAIGFLLTAAIHFAAFAVFGEYAYHAVIAPVPLIAFAAWERWQKGGFGGWDAAFVAYGISGTFAFNEITPGEDALNPSIAGALLWFLGGGALIFAHVWPKWKKRAVT